MNKTVFTGALLASLSAMLALGASSAWAAADAQSAAAPAAQSTATPEEAIAKSMKIDKSEVHVSPIPGLYEVRHNHDFGFASADGKFFIHGDLVEIDTSKNLTEDARRADRKTALAALNMNNTIEFAPAPPMAEKYVVTVFTDVDCGYCRRLHSQIADYNKLGITVRYAFFPRSGPNTESWSKAEAVWCSSDRRAAMTKAKQGQNISSHKCVNPVDEDFKLGYQLGVRGTPMIFMSNGEEIPGYLPPDDLLKELVMAQAGAVKTPTGAQQDPPLLGATPD